jgi:diguanylate cyclase (GGDEF)-like protein/PAS domain S-box-containing protein
VHALELLGDEDFSLLITDLKMPELSGMEVVKRIKKSGSDISIIVVTAMIEATNAIQAMRAGADDYVLKPFNLSEISLSVLRALEKRALIIENRAHQQQLESRVTAATEELAEANDEVRETKEYLESLIESTLDAIITIGPDARVAFANRGARHMTGYSGEEILTKGMDELYVGGPEEAQYVTRVLRADKPLQNYETELTHRNGSAIPVSMSISFIPAKEGRPTSTLAICKDITEQKRLELELKEMTIRDNLTGLYNQRYFYDRLEAEIERARRQERPLSLLLIDLDHFKSYNDSRGHLEGDKVLQEVGNVISECTREHVDFGFRYGGDEFTVILPEAQADTAHHIAERIRTMFEEKRFDLLTMSIGLTTYQEGYSVRKFIQFTDSLMYDAKRAGGNRVYVFGVDEATEESTAT